MDIPVSDLKESGTAFNVANGPYISTYRRMGHSLQVTVVGQAAWQRPEMVNGYTCFRSERIWYSLQRSEWSVHFNVSPDGTLFAGDGGGPSSVAAPGNGQWIYLFPI